MIIIDRAIIEYYRKIRVYSLLLVLVSFFIGFVVIDTLYILKRFKAWFKILYIIIRVIFENLHVKPVLENFIKI